MKDVITIVKTTLHWVFIQFSISIEGSTMQGLGFSFLRPK